MISQLPLWVAGRGWGAPAVLSEKLVKLLLYP